MFSNWAYILIGENNTGKTSFQRNLVEYLCQEKYERLPRNTVKNIIHPRAPKKLQTIFTANRSFQEKRGEYLSIQNYLDKFFQDADICILSSHSHGKAAGEIEEMIQGLWQRKYNVAGVFWSNDFGDSSRKISLLPWQERLWIDNPLLTDPDQIKKQLASRAAEFAEILISRAYAQ